MCRCTYIHTNVYTYIHIHLYIYMCSYTYVCDCTLTCMFIHSSISGYIYNDTYISYTHSYFVALCVFTTACMHHVCTWAHLCALVCVHAHRERSVGRSIDRAMYVHMGVQLSVHFVSYLSVLCLWASGAAIKSHSPRRGVVCVGGGSCLLSD